jgi:hypothetical protein
VIEDVPSQLLDLAKQIHPVWGPIGLVALLVGTKILRAVTLAMRTGQQLTRARQDRLNAGFASLDDGRKEDITRLRKEREEDDVRHRAEVDRLTALVNELYENRERGWDLARHAISVAHDMRHDGNTLAAAAYEAGKRGANRPAPIPPIPRLNELRGLKADEVKEHYT